MSNTEKQLNILQFSGAIKQGNRITIDHDLPSLLNEKNQCLGIIFHKEEENKTATLKSWNCDEKKRFFCSLDIFQFTHPTAKAKLPCMPSKIRMKREKEFDKTKDVQSDNG